MDDRLRRTRHPLKRVSELVAQLLAETHGAANEKGSVDPHERGPKLVIHVGQGPVGIGRKPLQLTRGVPPARMSGSDGAYSSGCMLDAEPGELDGHVEAHAA